MHSGLLGQGLIAGLTALNSGDNTGVTGIRSIFFNHNSLTTAAYFTQNNNLGLPSEAVWDTNNVMYKISEKVTEYYYVLRNLAIAALLFVLLYIAIRMALSTVSADEAKYKKMLVNWAVSLALVFVLHYIMIITFFVNNTIVDILDKTMGPDEAWNYAGLIGDALVPFAGFGEAIIFLMLVGMEITFLFMYIKRIIVLGFLIIIAPLITITYSIDKVGDGKSQALNTWLKEFIYNVIIQPFHCILYITMIKTVIDTMSEKEGVGGFIIYIIVLQFVKEAEEIIKKIFNIQAGSMPNIKNMGALAIGAMTAFNKGGKGASAVGKAKKMPKMTTEAGKEASKTKTPTKVGEKGATNEQTQSKPATKDTATTPANDTNNQTKNTDAPSTSNTDADSGNTDVPISNMDGNDTDGSTSPTSSSFKDRFKQGIKKFATDAESGAQGLMRYSVGSDEVSVRDGLKHMAKVGGTIAAAGIGFGMGDLNSAIGTGMAVSGIDSRIKGALDEHKNNKLLEDNEEIYDQNYTDYVREYSRITGITDEDKIRENLTSLFESYDNGSLNYDSIANEEERELKRKFLKESYEKLRDSYEAAGGEKPSDLAKAHTNNKASFKCRETLGI